MEGDLKLAFGADGFAIHGDLVVERVNFGAELADNLAVDLHTAVENELFAGAPGSNAGIGEEFLEAEGHEKVKWVK